MILIGSSANAADDDYWHEFLRQTDIDSFVRLKDDISENAQRCNWGDPGNRAVMSVETGQKLFRLIADGNEYAFRAGLLVARCLDGGELEDFYRSVGLFFEEQPSVFLQIAKESAVSKSSLKAMLTMLPLETVDNIDRAIDVIERRMSTLEGINEPDCEDMRGSGLSFLNEQKEALDRIKKQIDNHP